MNAPLQSYNVKHFAYEERLAVRVQTVRAVRIGANTYDLRTAIAQSLIATMCTSNYHNIFVNALCYHSCGRKISYYLSVPEILVNADTYMCMHSIYI